MPSTPRTLDPPFAGAFVLEIGGVQIGSFVEVSGLGVSMEIEEVKEGGNNEAPLKLPGRLSWTNLVLKRGITDNDSLFEWITSCSGDGLAGKSNKVTRRNGSVTLYDAGHQPVRSWAFREALPVRWAGPRFAAGGSDLAVEELEVSHGGFGG